MFAENASKLILSTLALFLLAGIIRLIVFLFRKPTYQELLDEKKMLHECVWNWKYPDGSLVPQHKRQKMFRDLQKISRQLRYHRDNPDNQT